MNELLNAFALDGRVAVAIGAGSGIGRETGRVLAEAGAAVMLADINPDALAEAADHASGAGGDVATMVTDVARAADLDRLAAQALDRFGRVDIWVNGAGIIVNAPMLDTTEADMERMIAVNLKAVYWGCVAAGRAMARTGGGAIVNISSGGGESANPGLALYSMTKAGVNMVTRSAAKELGPMGIRVNAVAPGWVDTPMGTHRLAADADEAERAAFIETRAKVSPLGITGVPRDIALATLYLASDASRFMTGQILRPNGGVAMP